MLSSAWRSAVDSGRCPGSRRFLRQQVVGDEQLGHRRDRDELVVAVGKQLMVGPVEDRDRDGGAVGGRVLGGLLDARRQSVEARRRAFPGATPAARSRAHACIAGAP